MEGRRGGRGGRLDLRCTRGAVDQDAREGEGREGWRDGGRRRSRSGGHTSGTWKWEGGREGGKEGEREEDINLCTTKMSSSPYEEPPRPFHPSLPPSLPSFLPPFLPPSLPPSFLQVMISHQAGLFLLQLLQPPSPPPEIHVVIDGKEPFPTLLSTQNLGLLSLLFAVIVLLILGAAVLFLPPALVQRLLRDRLERRGREGGRDGEGVMPLSDVLALPSVCVKRGRSSPSSLPPSLDASSSSMATTTTADEDEEEGEGGGEGKEGGREGKEGGMEEEERCSICLEEFVEGEMLKALPCRHAFHTG